MKCKKFVVLWHEDNDSGVPRHVMGQSPIFNTEREAKDWLESTIEEDRARFDENKHEEIVNGISRDDTFVFERMSNSDGVWMEVGNGQTCYYKIEQIEVDDRAADCVMELKEILAPIVIDGKPINSDERNKCALIYIGEHENEWLPLREWRVNLNFCDACCTQYVMAHTAAEAHKIMDDRIGLGEGGINLTNEDKIEMVNELLRHIDSVNVAGPSEEVS